MQFRNFIIFTHDDRIDVVSKGRVPFFIEGINDILNILIEISTVQNQTNTNATLCSVFQSGDNWILSPTPAPIHIEILQRQ